MTQERPITIRLFEYGVILSQLMRIANVAAHTEAMAAALEITPLQVITGPVANAFIAIGLALVITRGPAARHSSGTIGVEPVAITKRSASTKGC